MVYRIVRHGYNKKYRNFFIYFSYFCLATIVLPLCKGIFMRSIRHYQPCGATSNGGVHLFSYFLLLGDKRKYCKEKRLLHCYGYFHSTAGAQRASSPALTTMSCREVLRQAALSCARIPMRHTSLYGCLLIALILSPFHSKGVLRFFGFALE